MNFTQSAKYLRNKPLFYLLSIVTGGFAAVWWVNPVLVPLVVAFSVLLVALAMIDAKHYLLPNVLVGTLAVLGLGFAAIEALMLTPPDVDSLGFFLTRILVALLAMAVMLGLGWLGKQVAKRESMGLGDVKMVGAIALWVSLDGLVLTLLFASLLALPQALYSIICRLLKHRKQSNVFIPFGPYLAIGAWLSFMFRGIIWVALTVAAAGAQ